MHDCNHYQALLLEHLYGLVEGAESQALMDHVAACPACQAALDVARRHQRLLAAAAKQAFPAVRFEAPADEPAPATLPLAAPSRARRWARWAVAAALLLAAGGLGAPAAYYGHDYLQARATVATHAEQLTQAEQKVSDADDQLRRLPAEREQKLAAVQKEAHDRQLNVIVSGPQRVQVGAPSEYRIQTRNLDHQPVAARLDVRVVDQSKGQVILEEKDVKSAGDYQLTLQPNLPLRPDATLALEVNARREGDADANSVLHERLELAAPVYVTHLATDRPMYQLGDTVRFRSLTLERFSLRPPPDDFRLVYSMTRPNGEKTVFLSGSSRLRAGANGPEVNGPDGRPLRGLGAGEYVLDGNEGGEYTLTVSE
ncbi:MAG TPA: hypothetical protein VFA26_07695, partial [Gemmataceae bacterium]|nr:hypothetical protein [Gemmataceae bacterium]